MKSSKTTSFFTSPHNKITLFTGLLLLTLSVVSSQPYFQADDDFYTSRRASFPDFFNDGYDLPVQYNRRSPHAASYPVAPILYEMELMDAFEPMPGKKTVPLYVIPEDSINFHRPQVRRSKYSLRYPTKYPEFYGLTDGSHIPAVEIPLNGPISIKQLPVDVLAPAGFMVPYNGDDGEYPYPMHTGCLVAPVPTGSYVSQYNPMVIKKVYAVPSLPRYPTSRPVINQHIHKHYHYKEGEDDLDDLFEGKKPKKPVFELVPVKPPPKDDPPPKKPDPPPPPPPPRKTLF